MSQWLFDLGNSRLKCAPLDAAGELGEVRALGHDESAFVERLRECLPDRADSACLASVASPALTAAVLDALVSRFRRISIARTQRRFAGVRIAYAEPAKLGVDRFLALLAARARGAGPWLVAGVGTALTVDLLDADGNHRGGRIAPSPRLMREALQRAAAQLPAQGGDYVEFAADTADALASGCDGAAVALVERSLRLAREELGAAPRLLLHGGGGEALRAWLPQAEPAPSLVLQGLAIWARAGRDRSDPPSTRSP
ncbi:type III pantothenate kinase [Pseudoxanthomonas sangjuensis]|uniref:type III pantothenate kinase n=1 Tax=Pseudoxanthomonas sangjuensis TaxID=1503750 RepID=UPI001390CBDD|nr:type III pantothenate kinase [Pseudoxanthomonas sangjuensis]KAF1713872.1 pantothenate kinase [Pseudoxanthomonas sangjuensis]